MPTYEYECKKCEHRFEAFQSMSDDPLKTCPECKGEVRRLIGAGAGIIFKGSGFYVTDSRKSSSSTSSTGESKKSDSSGSSTSDSSNGSSKGSDSKTSDTSKSGGAGKSDGKKSGSQTSKKSG